jgi:hypothetical protein
MTTATGPDGLVLISTKCTSSARSVEWEAWYVDDYLPLLVGGPITRASAWRLDGAPAPGGPGPGHTHTTRIDLHGDTIAGATDLDAAVARIRADGRMHPAHAEIAVDLWSAHGPAHPPLDAESPRRAMIIAEVMCTDPAREAEWDRWYDDQHVPDMLSSEAFAAASRWVRTPRRGSGCDHLTVYEIAGFDAAEAVRRSAAVMPGLVAAGRKHECHTGGRTLALNRTEPGAE